MLENCKKFLKSLFNDNKQKNVEKDHLYESANLINSRYLTRRKAELGLVLNSQHDWEYPSPYLLIKSYSANIIFDKYKKLESISEWGKGQKVFSVLVMGHHLEAIKWVNAISLAVTDFILDKALRQYAVRMSCGVLASIPWM